MQEKDKEIHVITLNIPDPPNYGGMIDTFYRIKALHSLGVKIHLHCFEYGRCTSNMLEKICETVHYYPRRKGWLVNFTTKPFIVASRNSDLLLQQLLKDKLPILFDGLHTTFHLSNPALKDRFKAVRLHNIEHLYYRNLYSLEPLFTKKMFFFLEAIRLRYYERVLSNAKLCFPISIIEFDYFDQKYKNAAYLPSFHPFKTIMSLPGKGKFILFHGDLSVSENIQTCTWLIREVFSKSKYPCIIAGKKPPESIRRLVSDFTNITIVADPKEEQMSMLIREAHIHILMALKNNGLKLKLLISLFAGRYCLVNPIIVENTIFDKLCFVASNASEFLQNIDRLMEKPFTQDAIDVRKNLLNIEYNNDSNALKMINAMMP